MLTVVCSKGARLQLRVKLSNPHNFPSFATLATMRMLFSIFVVSLDICALAHIGIQENELLQSGFNSTIESHKVAIGTLIIDAMATQFSGLMFSIGLVVECGHFCCQRWKRCRLICQRWMYDECLSSCFRFGFVQFFVALNRNSLRRK